MNRKLHLAVAAAFAAAMVGPAFAANINVLPSTDPNGAELTVGGATATDRSLAIGWLQDLCNSAATPAAPGAPAGTNIEVFTSIGTFIPGTTRNYAIACRMAATANGVSANQDTVLIKYSGGSATGVTQVANNQTLATSGSANWVNYQGCRDGAGNPVGGASVANVAAAGGLPAYRLFTNCPINGTPIVPKTGVSDVEPALQVAGGGALPLIAATGASVPFSVAVSQNFFEALQTAQGLVGCTGALASYTPQCTPNLTSAQIRGIFKGQILTVNRFFDQGGTAIPNPAGGGLVYVCRRGNTSGTQVSFASYFLGQGCGTQHTFVGATTAGCNTNGCAFPSGGGATANDRVFAGTGSGDVTACLDEKTAASRYGVGILSLESSNFNDTNQRWRFVKLDGVMPTLENTVRGEYSFFTESSCNRPSGASANTLSPIQLALAQGGVVGTTATGLCGAIRGDVVSVNPSGTFQWLLGTLAVPPTNQSSSAPPISTATVLGNPINSQTRAAAYGSAPNNCNPPWSSSRTSIANDDLDNP